MRVKIRKTVLATAICLVLGGGALYGFAASDSAPAVHRLRLSEDEPARYLQGLEAVTQDQLELSLGDQSRPGNYISIPNHTELLSRKPVPTPEGEGELIKFVQGEARSILLLKLLIIGCVISVPARVTAMIRSPTI